METQSPKPIKVEMSFDEAIKEILNSKKVHKKEWQDKEYWAELKEGYLRLHKPDGKYYFWQINDGDLNGEDYIVIE